MPDPLLLTAAAAVCVLVFRFALHGRRRRAAMRAMAIELAWSPVEEQRIAPDIAPSIEAAERQLALILGRMRAYLRDPYDVGTSRIRGDGEFEDCLDLVARLREHIAVLEGAAIADGPDGRSRLRRQVLDGLLWEAWTAR